MKEEFDIDKIFQEKLGKGHWPEGDWSDPGDHVFLEAMNRISDDKSRRKFGFIWWMSGVLLLIIAGISMLMLHKISSLESKIIPSTESSLLKMEKADQANTEATIEEESKALPPTSPQVNKSISIHSTQASSDDQLTETRNTTPQKSSSPSFTQKNNQLSNSSQAQTHKNQKIDEIDGLVNVIQPIRWALSKIYLPVISEISPDPIWSKNTMGLFGHLSQTTLTMQNIQVKEGSLVDYDQYYINYSAGLFWEHRITKQWSLLSQLGYHHLTNQSTYKKDCLFEQASVFNGNNYAFQTDIYSPLSQRNEDLVMELKNTGLQEGDAMKQKTKINSSVHTLFLSVVPQYSIWSHEKIRLHIGLGPRLNYHSTERVKQRTLMYHQNEVAMTEKSENVQSSNLQQWSLGLTSNISAQYALSNHYRIGLSLQGDWGLSSMNKNIINKSGETYYQAFGINLMMGYQF